MEILPISFGFPFGLTAILPPNIPLPSKIVTRVLDPIDIAALVGATYLIGKVGWLPGGG